MKQTLTWEKLYSREEKLKLQQEENLPKILKTFDKLGFEVVNYTKISDGWMTGFSIYKFIVKDKRNCVRDKDNTYVFFGNDNNTTIYKEMPSGGKALFKVVKDVL